MKTRIVTALVLIPLLVLVLISPAPVVTAAVMAVCVIGLYEFFKAVGISKKRCLCALGYAAAVVIPLGAYAGGIWDISRLYMPLAYLFMLLVFLVMLTQHKTVSFSDAAALIFAVIYIPYFLTHIIYVREALNGKILIWLVFIGAFLTDSGAYFAGVFFAKMQNEFFAVTPPYSFAEKQADFLIPALFLSTFLEGGRNLPPPAADEGR